MRFGGSVRGIPTAASIWIVAALGLSIGAGMYFVSVVATLLTLFTLSVLNHIERRIFTDRAYKLLEVNVRDTKISTEAVLAILTEYGIHVSNVDVSQAIQKKTVKMKLLVKISENTDLTGLYAALDGLPNVHQVKLEQPG